MNNKIKVSLKNIVQVFFSVNNIKDRPETDELKQMIIEEMIEKGGLPVWDRDKNDCRVRVPHLIKFGDIVELQMIDEYSDISQDDLDRLEARRAKMEKEKVSERQTLKAGVLCSDVIDETFSLTDKALKERDIELKNELITVAGKFATHAVKLQQIHMMRSGLLPPMSANKDTQQAWEQKAINQYEAEREKRKQARTS